MGCCDGCFDSSACGRRRILSTLVIFNGTWQRSTRRPKSIGSIDAVSMRFGEARGGAHERHVVVGCRRRRWDVERAWGLAPRRKNGFLNQHAVCDKKAESALPGGAHDHLSGAPHGPCQMCRWGGARVGRSVASVNVTFLSSHMLRCLMPRARLERRVPSRRGHV